PQMFPAYIKKYGKAPPVTYMSSDEDALTKLRGGFVADTGHPNVSSVPRWHDAGVLRPIDVSRLSHWPDVFDEVKKLKDASSGGQYWIVPMSFGNTSIIYRKDLVDPKYQDHPTWGILWDERYKGKIAPSDTMEDVVGSAALVAGFRNPWSMTDAEIAK